VARWLTCLALAALGFSAMARADVASDKAALEADAKAVKVDRDALRALVETASTATPAARSLLELDVGAARSQLALDEEQLRRDVERFREDSKPVTPILLAIAEVDSHHSRHHR
jgi:hypothetical protein